MEKQGLSLILTVFTIIGSSLLSLVLLAIYMNRTIPKILDDVGVSIGETFTEIFKDPMAKRAMTILGKKSGEVRLNAAAEKSLANNILNNLTPELRIILDRIAPDFIEEYGPETVLQLATKYAPMLQQFIPNIQQFKKEQSNYGWNP